MNEKIPIEILNPFQNIIKKEPFYHTNLGAAYLGDSIKLLKKIPDESINLIMTSPPFALQFKKEYGNVSSDEYVKWFIKKFSYQFFRILTEDGSLVIDIGGSWNKGKPTKSLYNYDLLLKLCKERSVKKKKMRFHLAQDFFWYNPAALPTPAEWVNVKRIRVKAAVNTIWWLSKTENPKANNRNVLKPYSKAMQQLLVNGYRAKERPSGYKITTKFNKDHGGAIPPNFLEFGNNESNSEYLTKCGESNIKAHPARFPKKLPEFFIKFLTSPGDIVLDPFAGSNVTGEAAEDLGRKWISFEIIENYLEGSKHRFASIMVS
jgi:site-specific DNA-methyltransferase (cytosine-N4-specific)